MKKMSLLIAMGAGLIVGCSAEGENYDSGYSDGYAVGYNEICYPNRSNMVWGHWDSEKYSSGYRAGKSHGASDARSASKTGGRYDCPRS